ncbi:unnamed protein product [Ilex paraguariensis]|uniref:ATP synthase F0 subunit 6 n=1 Tax=Ilex paraguariensis TaxID=185542 RepID=A0ABC8SGC6_9AQUA
MRLLELQLVFQLGSLPADLILLVLDWAGSAGVLGLLLDLGWSSAFPAGSSCGFWAPLWQFFWLMSTELWLLCWILRLGFSQLHSVTVTIDLLALLPAGFLLALLNFVFQLGCFYGSVLLAFSIFQLDFSWILQLDPPLFYAFLLVPRLAGCKADASQLVLVNWILAGISAGSLLLFSWFSAAFQLVSQLEFQLVLSCISTGFSADFLCSFQLEFTPHIVDTTRFVQSLSFVNIEGIPQLCTAGLQLDFQLVSMGFQLALMGSTCCCDCWAVLLLLVLLCVSMMVADGLVAVAMLGCFAYDEGIILSFILKD